MASLLDLPGVAEQLLSDFASQLTENGVALPERQYRSPGSMVVWDGEQFTVSIMTSAQGQPGIGQPHSVVPQAVVYYATFSLNLVRAIAVINTEGMAEAEIPTADEMDEDGVSLMADASALIYAASQIHQQYLVTAVGEGFAVEGLQPVGPEGGLAGNRLLVSLSLS